MLAGCDGLLRLTLARRIATNGRFAPIAVVPEMQTFAKWDHASTASASSSRMQR